VRCRVAAHIVAVQWLPNQQLVHVAHRHLGLTTALLQPLAEQSDLVVKGTSEPTVAAGRRVEERLERRAGRRDCHAAWCHTWRIMRPAAAAVGIRAVQARVEEFGDEERDEFGMCRENGTPRGDAKALEGGRCVDGANQRPCRPLQRQLPNFVYFRAAPRMALLTRLVGDRKGHRNRGVEFGIGQDHLETVAGQDVARRVWLEKQETQLL
jgi:hypothetical protein